MHDRRDNVTSIDTVRAARQTEAEEFSTGEFIAAPSVLPPAPLIPDDMYDVAIVRALKLPDYHHGPRIVLVCEIVEGGWMDTALCRFYQAKIVHGRWQTKTGLQAHYRREARAIVGDALAAPNDFVGLLARASVVPVLDREGEPAYSKIQRLSKHE